VASKNGTNSWCDPFKTWHKILSFDPFANLTSEQVSSGRVYGGQVALWAEQTDEQTLDGMLWPRAAALAELFWGGDRGGKEACPRDARKWMASIHDVRNRMVERGVRANILQPHWCALRPGE
jgi:hexosaminidase